MINLLPPDQQKEIRAARSNTLLLRYLILLAGALGFLLCALGVTYFSLITTAQQADEVKRQNEQAATGYSETQTTANTLRSELSSAKSLFDNEIRYSKLLTRFSSLFPQDTSIKNFSIDRITFTQPVVLPVHVAGESQAKQLHDNFVTSPYVTNVSMGRVSTNGEGQGYVIELTFTFDRSIVE